jgi:hypothetical protein
MDPTQRESLDILAQLTPQRRVAIACVALEHLMELYERGPVKALSDKAIAGIAPGSDLVAVGLQLAWRYAEGKSVDAAQVRAVEQALQKQRKQLLQRAKDADKQEGLLLGVSVGPIIGAAETLLAIDAKKPTVAANAMDRAITSIQDLIEPFTDDEELPVEEMYRESAWQTKVARRARDLGDKPVDRRAFADLLGEKLAWHGHVDAFAERAAALARSQAGGAAQTSAAARAARAKPAAKKPTAKPKPATTRKSAAKRKPASKAKNKR